MTTLPDVLIATHDQAQHAIGEALIDRLRAGDQLASALTSVQTVHIALPDPTGRPDPDCPGCEGTGTLVYQDDDGGEESGDHCHCRCPWCAGCHEPVCEGPCETIATIAEALGLETL